MSYEHRSRHFLPNTNTAPCLPSTPTRTAPLHHVHIARDPFCCWKDQSWKDAGKPTGDGGGGGGCWTVELESVQRANLGRGEAMTALDTSWPRQWLVARERRRRFGGRGEDIVKEVVLGSWIVTDDKNYSSGSSRDGISNCLNGQKVSNVL